MLLYPIRFDVSLNPTDYVDLDNAMRVRIQDTTLIISLKDGKDTLLNHANVGLAYAALNAILVEIANTATAAGWYEMKASGAQPLDVLNLYTVARYQIKANSLIASLSNQAEITYNFTDQPTLTAFATNFAAALAALPPETFGLQLSDIGVTIQGYDAGLGSLAGLTGTGVVTATATNTFAMRAIGAASTTDILDRQTADARYALSSGTYVTDFNTRTGAVTLTSGDVTGALAFTPLNATAYTAADVLAKLLTVDGAASGLDADLLDGQSSAYYQNAGNLNAGTLASARLTGTYAISVSGSAATLTTPRTIGGVSFDGSANINLPGVNTVGTQNTSGSAATLTTPRTIGGVSFNGSANISLPGVDVAGTQNTSGSAATLTTGRTLAITGDLAWTSPAFNGSGNVTAVGTLATVNPNVGSFGSATATPTFTVNAKGLLTAAGSVTITPAWSSITSIPAGVTSLAGLTGAGVITATSTGVLAMRTIGATSSTDMLDRAAGDGRYALTGSGVTAFNTRTGAVTLTSGDVTGALSYTPLNATAYTAADVLAKLLTVDGAASGLDADLLDGQQGSFYQSADNLNAGTILAARLPAFTGDVTTVAGTTTTTLATVNGNIGAFGSSTAIPIVTVNAKGLITAVTTANVTPAWGSITSTPTTLAGYGITNAVLKTGDTMTGNLLLTGGGTYAEPATIAGVLAFDNTGGDFTISARSNGGNTALSFRTSSAGTGAERMRITAAGLVGIGLTVPTATLHVNGSVNLQTGSGVLVNARGLSSAWFSSGESLTLQSGSAAHILFNANGERMRITNTGLVGINRTDPADQLDVNGNVRATRFYGLGTTGYIQLDDSVGVHLNYGAGRLVVGGPLLFYGSSIERFRVNADGTSSFSSSSITAAGNAIWHAGNDGAASGLDADLLDGQQGAFYQSAANLNAGTLLAARMPALTGDITTASGAVATTLATVNSNVGSFGSATQVATFTVNAKGLTTAAGNVTITPAWGSVTGIPAGVTSLAGLTGAGVVTATSTGVLAMRAIGASATTDILDRATGDARYALASGGSGVTSFNTRTGAVTLTSGDVTGALTFTPLNATAYTAADVLAKLITVDGAASGLDADLLDGVQGSGYVNTTATQSVAGSKTFNNLTTFSNADYVQQVIGSSYNGAQRLWLGSVADSVGTFIGGNAYYQSSFNFMPNHTSASGINFRQDGSTEFWNDTGLTSGVAYLPTKRMTILAGGNVGIGTAAPGQKLDVAGAAVFGGAATRLTTYSDSAYSGIFNGASLTSAESIYMGAGGLFFYGGGSERMRIASGGKVIIGATAVVASEVLSVNGRVRAGTFRDYDVHPGTFYGAEPTNTLTALTLHQAGVSTIMLGSKANDTNLYLTNDYGGAGLGNAATSVTIASGGNVGIGIAAPAAKLHAYLTPSANNTVDDVLKVTSKFNAVSGASAATGSGPAIVFSGGIGDNQERDRARIVAVYEGLNVSGLAFHTQNTADIITEKMRIQATTGNVGIGTASPLAKLQVGDGSALTNYQGSVVGIMLPVGSGAWLELADNSTYGTAFRISQDSNTGIAFNSNGRDIGFRAAGYNNAISASQIVLKQSGNVGIGTTAPTAKLHLATSGATQVQIQNTSGTTRNTQLLFTNNSGTGWRIGSDVGTNNNTDNFQIYKDALAAAVVTVDSSGNVGFGTTSPSTQLDLNSLAAAITLTPSNYGGSYRTVLGTTSGAMGILQFGNNGGNQIRFGHTAAGGAGSIYVNNTVGYTTATDGILAMHFTSAGNVGIGNNTAPAHKLTVTGGNLAVESGGAYLSSGNALHFNYNVDNNYYIGKNGSNLYLNTGGTFAMMSGDVGIGTASPLHKLDVAGTLRHTGVITNAAGIKTYSVSTVDQGNVNSTYEIMRVSRDTVNWSSNIPYEITVYSRYFNSGGRTKWLLSYGYDTAGTFSCIDARGPQKFRVYLGAEVTVSGNVRYRPVLVDIPNYYQVSIEVKFNTDVVTSITSSSQVHFTGTMTTGTGALYSGDTHLVPDGGNIGIGTTGPLGKLQGITTTDTTPNTISAFDARHTVFGPSTADGLAFSKGTSGSAYISSVRPGVAWDPLAIQASTLSFNPSAGTAAFHVTNGGNVGIGTTSPADSITIRGGTQALLIETSSDPVAYRAKLTAQYNYGNPVKLTGLNNEEIIGQYNGYNVRIGGTTGAVGIGTTPGDSVFKLIVGEGTVDNRSLFRSSNEYSVGIRQGATNGTFYIGATATADPALTFSRNNGTRVASLSPEGNLIVNGTITAGGSAVWTSGNDGAGSGLDANLFNGLSQAQLDTRNMEVVSQRDFVNGTLVTTNINYAVSSGDPFVLEISSNNYGELIPTKSTYQGYIYSDTMISTGGISSGRDLAGIVLMNVGGNLCFWWPRQGYWHGYTVRCYVPDNYTNNAPLNRVTSITDTTKPAGTKEVNLNANRAIGWHSFNHGSGSGLNADLLDGLHAASLAKTIDAAAWNVSPGNDANVARNLRWTNYGTGHVIFDASQSISPSGTSVNNTNPANGWAATYPTLMGWNGGSTFGVRVEIARFAEIHSSNNTLWHAGNDGAGSGLDADLLDGLNSTQFMRSDALGSNTNCLLSAVDGNGVRFWGGDSQYSMWMSSAANGTWGGRVGGETTSDYNMYFRMASGTNRGFVFKNSATNVAGIDGAGNFRCIADIVAYSSDARLKTNIVAIESPLDKISKIGGYTFDWDRELTTKLGFTPYQYENEHGFIAQEIEKIIPDAVRPAPFNADYLTVKYERVIPLVVAGVNELAEKNAILESKVADLENKIASILEMLEEQKV